MTKFKKVFLICIHMVYIFQLKRILRQSMSDIFCTKIFSLTGKSTDERDWLNNRRYHWHDQWLRIDKFIEAPVKVSIGIPIPLIDP